jgi:hypothetical protein
LGGLIQLRLTAFGRFIPSGLAEISSILFFAEPVIVISLVVQRLNISFKLVVAD